MQRRRFGKSGVATSVLAFGAMRLDDRRLDPGAALDLLLALVDGGLTTFHSSVEYPSHELFCRLLRALRAARPSLRPVHVAKIGVPHFDEDRFSADRLRRLVEAQLRDLGTERIDIVQWLVRQTPNVDAPRLARLAECRDEIAWCWDRLQAAGKVGALAVFPYSRAFAEAALALPCVDGLIDYLNPHEGETAHLLGGLAAQGRGFLAIRPFAAGRVSDPLQAFRVALAHPAVACAIASIGSLAHARSALAALTEMEELAAA